MDSGRNGRDRENWSYSGYIFTADLTDFANGWHVRYKKEVSSMTPRFWPDWKKDWGRG